METTRGTLTFGPEVVMGDPGDPELGLPVLSLVMTSRNHLVVLTPGQVVEFDAEGSLVRQVSRTGDAPGEFGRPRGVAVGPNDSLFIFHSGGALVFDSAGTFAREERIREPPLQPRRLASGEFVSITASGLSADGSTIFLHSPQWDRRSFAPDSARRAGGSALAGPLVLGPASGSSFWVASRSTYRLERWNAEGEVERVVEPPADHLPIREHTRILASGRSVTTNTPYVNAVAQDREGRIWTAVLEIREDGEGDLPPGAPRFDSIIEVRDPESGELLATGRLPGSVASIEPSGHLVVGLQDEAGRMHLMVRRAHVDTGPGVRPEGR